MMMMMRDERTREENKKGLTVTTRLIFLDAFESSYTQVFFQTQLSFDLNPHS